MEQDDGSPQTSQAPASPESRQLQESQLRIADERNTDRQLSVAVFINNTIATVSLILMVLWYLGAQWAPNAFAARGWLLLLGVLALPFYFWAVAASKRRAKLIEQESQRRALLPKQAEQ